jgi:hypothetical protein
MYVSIHEDNAGALVLAEMLALQFTHILRGIKLLKIE